MMANGAEHDEDQAESETCTCDRTAFGVDGKRNAHKPGCAWLEYARMMSEAIEENRRFDGGPGSHRGHHHG